MSKKRSDRFFDSLQGRPGKGRPLVYIPARARKKEVIFGNLSLTGAVSAVILLKPLGIGLTSGALPPYDGEPVMKE